MWKQKNREEVSEIVMFLMAYEVTRDMPLEASRLKKLVIG